MGLPSSLSPYLSAAFPQTANAPFHSFLAAIEAASAVAHLQQHHHQQQQQQHLLNNNNNSRSNSTSQSPEIKRPIPHIAVGPSSAGQTLVDAFKKSSNYPPVAFPFI